MAAAVGRGQLKVFRELADERGLIEAQCAFCGVRYVFSRGELDEQ